MEDLELDFGFQNGALEWRWLLTWTATGAEKCLPLLFPLPPRPCNKYSFRFDRVVPSSSTNRRHKECGNMTLGQIVSTRGSGTNLPSTRRRRSIDPSTRTKRRRSLPGADGARPPVHAQAQTELIAQMSKEGVRTNGSWGTRKACGLAALPTPTAEPRS